MHTYCRIRGIVLTIMSQSIDDRRGKRSRGETNALVRSIINAVIPLGECVAMDAVNITCNDRSTVALRASLKAYSNGVRSNSVGQHDEGGG